MPNIGLPELLIIVLVIFFFFGAKKIPEFMRGLTGAAKEFREGMKSEPDEESKKSSKS